jgi:glycosyltransferase involved in cell wall biosynthesis
MFDSIHAGRWLNQFVDQEIDFILYPSKKFKKIHPKIAALLNSNLGATFSINHPVKIKKILGYLDFLFFVQLSKISRRNLRVDYLRKILAKNEFDFVHALEIQGAGYLCNQAIKNKNFKFIVTNWGSDIFYFRHLEEHLPRIKSVLKKADSYSAECQRDYNLAIELGFKGNQLPCIPNAGGLVSGDNLEVGIPTSLRKNIVVKTYGGTFGRGGLAIEAVANVLEENSGLTAYFYSVTDDLLEQIRELKSKFGIRVKFSTQKNPVSEKELASIFANSRVYIGCSISDGVSTSFLEALTKGVYPIQTNTSCAGEWVDKGVIASLVPLNLDSIKLELGKAVLDNALVDKASECNLSVANEYLRFENISAKAKVFYQ